MQKSLEELKQDWARQKARYDALLHTWFPPVEPSADPPPLKPVPPEVMAELERMEKEVEQARRAYVSALLYGSHG